MPNKESNTDKNNNEISRREFVKTTTLGGTGLLCLGMNFNQRKEARVTDMKMQKK